MAAGGQDMNMNMKPWRCVALLWQTGRLNTSVHRIKIGAKRFQCHSTERGTIWTALEDLCTLDLHYEGQTVFGEMTHAYAEIIQTILWYMSVRLVLSRRERWIAVFASELTMKLPYSGVLLCVIRRKLNFYQIIRSHIPDASKLRRLIQQNTERVRIMSVLSRPLGVWNRYNSAMRDEHACRYTAKLSLR